MYLLFDAGGTKIRFAVSRDYSTVEEIKILPVPKEYSEVLELFQKEGGEYGGKFDKIVGGIAGPLDSQKSMMVASPNLPNWVNKPLKQDLEKMFSTEVILENDAALGGLGEAVYGAGKGEQIVAYITLSTGIGGARIVDGKIDVNSFGFEPGHMILDPNGPTCNCEVKGDFESLASGTALEKKYERKAIDLDNQQVWNEEARIIALALNNISVLWSPEVIVLGGSIMNKVDIEKVKNYLKDILRIFPTLPEVKKWELHEETSLWGALARSKQQLTLP